MMQQAACCSAKAEAGGGLGGGVVERIEDRPGGDCTSCSELPLCEDFLVEDHSLAFSVNQMRIIRTCAFHLRLIKVLM